jgi:hypothetical protein
VLLVREPYTNDASPLPSWSFIRFPKHLAADIRLASPVALLTLYFASQFPIKFIYLPRVYFNSLGLKCYYLCATLRVTNGAQVRAKSRLTGLWLFRRRTGCHPFPCKRSLPFSWPGALHVLQGRNLLRHDKFPGQGLAVRMRQSRVPCSWLANLSWSEVRKYGTGPAAS